MDTLPNPVPRGHSCLICLTETFHQALQLISFQVRTVSHWGVKASLAKARLGWSRLNKNPLTWQNQLQW